MHSRRSCPQRWILFAYTFTCTPSPLRPPVIARSAFFHSSCPSRITRTHPRPSLNLTSSNAPSLSDPTHGRTATATATFAHKDASRVYRALFDHNLSRLTNKDLSSLLESTGLPQSGTKTVLTSRLSACFSSIMGQVDSIHQTGELALPCSSSTSSSAETIITPPTSPSPLAGESKESLPSLLHYNPQQRRAIQDHILPESIISIDIGIRNLAWVELSKEGEILRWSVVDLLAPDECNNGTEPLEELPSTAAAKESVEAKDSQSRMTLMAAEMKGTVVKKSRLRKKTTAPLVEAAPYDPHLVAVRLDKALNDILPESTSSRAPQKIVIERQRYRSGGLPEILDSTIRCAVIEGMIHCWVTAWNNRNRQRTLRPLENLNGHQGNIQMDHKDDVFIEVVPPKSVAQWWGIGQVGAIRASSLTKTAGEQDLLKKRTLPSISYQTKKKQSVALVNEWLDSESADLSTTIPSEPSRFRVWCTSAMKAWFGAEKKKDDLSDCLLQAVAWYEWRSRAIQEALDWSTAEPVEKKAKVKKVPRKSKKDDEKTRATNK